jgi:ketosteroid isomerase-like protein
MGLQAFLIVAMAVLASRHYQEDVAKEVETAVHAIQTAFNKGDVDTLKYLMSDDLVTILTYAHFSNAADQLKALSDWKFSEYKIDELKVKVLTRDVALASYKAAIKGTYQGKEVPSPVRVAEVWVKRDGRWVQASYQETPMGEK